MANPNPLREQARALAGRLYRGGMTEHHLDLIEAALRDMQRETVFALTKSAVARLRRDTIQQDAVWMQHKGNCGKWEWKFECPAKIIEANTCTCGLADRLKEIEK